MFSSVVIVLVATYLLPFPLFACLLSVGATALVQYCSSCVFFFCRSSTVGLYCCYHDSLRCSVLLVRVLRVVVCRLHIANWGLGFLARLKHNLWQQKCSLLKDYRFCNRKS